MPDHDLESVLEHQQNRYYGLYVGTVAETYDGERGELMVSVPQVFGRDVIRKAKPAVPFAGAGQGLFAMPPRGTSVWIAFEAGMPSHPVWVGCLWADRDIDRADNNAKIKFFKTDKFSLRIDDSLGEVEISNTNGAKITLGATSVRIEGPMITVKTKSGREIALDAASVDINKGGATFI